jgi:hypothetical protein
MRFAGTALCKQWFATVSNGTVPPPLYLPPPPQGRGFGPGGGGGKLQKLRDGGRGM